MPKVLRYFKCANDTFFENRSKYIVFSTLSVVSRFLAKKYISIFKPPPQFSAHFFLHNLEKLYDNFLYTSSRFLAFLRKLQNTRFETIQALKTENTHTKLLYMIKKHVNIFKTPQKVKMNG
jgi:hypothetical protein